MWWGGSVRRGCFEISLFNLRTSKGSWWFSGSAVFQGGVIWVSEVVSRALGIRFSKVPTEFPGTGKLGMIPGNRCRSQHMQLPLHFLWSEVAHSNFQHKFRVHKILAAEDISPKLPSFLLKPLKIAE